ncbi:hypothetical protein KC332_g2489 [Hortaea werneckii]|uniref:ZW10 C-terminal helical domain-containing protein n=2 Tax=Hortaea werneckii TaxID=91943 RepID=A0A3M7J9X1_HORWE|nr:hypothetical protein KC350_g9282 [Hortaea werneckii]OTA31165.1 hypothetical protein BTJ68_08543 [Hortaea werneckii EXF-2000]KAI6846149.1 hypothetical protein KC358_g3002 [Hortaea werneckii]KAI6942212.1 hypothetical protein KC341_g2401 [Hortaea werneckii]KAI6945653.1 hypothetical protein KC348_g3665 [Hortaea werneckii]
MATADPVPDAVLSYINNGAYPDSDEVASASLDSSTLGNLLQSLQHAQDEVKKDIRSLSKDTAPDIDDWISKAKSLQQDILRSRDTARQIVAEHEAGRELKAKVQDKAIQVRLLEKEVAFEDTLGGTLEHIRYANGVLQSVQNEAVGGDLTKALNKLETAQESIDGLESVRETKAYGLLQGRAKHLREGLKETATAKWNEAIAIKDRKVAVTGTASSLSLEGIAKPAQGLAIFDGLLQKLSKDLERDILKPRMTASTNGQVAKFEVTGKSLLCSGQSSDLSYKSLFQDLETMIDFLARELPSSVSLPLSDSLVLALANRLEEQWLEPAVPLDVNGMPGFQETLGDVQHLADAVEKHGWHGAKQLRDWVQSAPRTWLTKRREAVLGDVRNLVLVGLRETKTVERVETQMISQDDQQALRGDGGGQDDDWDTAWDEPEEDAKPDEAPPSAGRTEDEDEASAWDAEDMEKEPAHGDGNEEDDEGDAWGWGDEDANKPASPVASKPPAPKASGVTGTVQMQQPAEREMTLRETFSVTLIPDGVIKLLQQIIADAQSLAGPEYASSPIAPAASALYTLPTLALAIYRATAPTVYAKLDTGNMLIYNDANQLASQLREWQSSQPPTSRLRLDADVKALENFAKKAYASEMDSQRTVIRDLLDGAQGFTNVTKPPFKAESESAIEQTVDRLRALHTQWKPVLSSAALLQSLGSLLAAATAKIIADVEDLGDIGEEDSHQLRRLMEKVTAVKDLFAAQVSSPDGQPSTTATGQDMTFIYCPNWLKFQYLAEILESSLADIKYLWNEGELSLEFEAEEVCELIEGLFADSDMRRRAMAEIRRGGAGGR